MNAYEKQTEQLRILLAAAQGSKELYARVIGCLVNAITNGDGIMWADDFPCIPAADIEALADVSTVRLEQAVMGAPDDEPDADDIPIVVLVVEPKGGDDGHDNGSESLVIPPSRPRLVL